MTLELAPLFLAALLHLLETHPYKRNSQSTPNNTNAQLTFSVSASIAIMMNTWQSPRIPLGNDIWLLHSGNFADATVECQGRTWNVHRGLLSSRLKFFRAAFTGDFAEAASRKVDLPEATPDSVDIMLRHLYGEVLDTKDLKTPLLCVRSWKLADYLQLESLKDVAIWALQDHLDAMVLLASNNKSLETAKPIWLGHFVDAFREVCAHAATEALQNMFIAFLWVTRFKMLLPQTLEVLNKHNRVNNKLLQLLARNKFEKTPPCWFPASHSEYNIEQDIHDAKAMTFKSVQSCAKCGKDIQFSSELMFYNPFPISPTFSEPKKEIGQLIWCKRCADKFSEDRSWPWRWRLSFGGRNEIKLEAWSWSRGE